MAETKTRVIVFTAGHLQRDVELFIDRLESSEHVELVAVVVDQWRRPWKRLQFLLKRWGLWCFLTSIAYRAVDAFSVTWLWRKWHDSFVPVKSEAAYSNLENNGICVRYSDDINSAQSAEQIAKLSPDLGVIVGGRILKDRITQLPRLGTLNIHKHDATKYRGSPQIGYPERLNGDETLGVSIHFATSKVDQGDIVSMVDIPIERCDDDRSLGVKAGFRGMDAYFHAVESIATGQYTRRPQQPSSGKTYITTPYVDRVRFWRCYRRLVAQTFVRPGAKLWFGVVQAIYRAVRFASCMAVLPWLTRERKYQEAEGKAPIVVFYYHGIGNGGENWMTLPMHRLHEDVNYLRKHYTILSLREAVERLRSGTNHETAAVLTFDDGYASCYDNLVPYLNYYQIPATIFACPAASAGESLHDHDLRHSCSDAKLMTIAQLTNSTSEYVEIGSHGNFHEDMGRLRGRDLERAIVGSGDDLESLTNRDVRHFSFPFGKKHHMSRNALARGRKRYDAMFSAYGGYNFPDEENWFHFQRIANPITLSSMVAIMSGLHRFRPFYVDRPDAYCDTVTRTNKELLWSQPRRPELARLS